MLSNSESKSSQKSTHPVVEASKAKRDDTSRDDLLDSSIKPEEISPASPTLLACSSRVTNKIRIVELETKQEFANFDGVQLKGAESETHVKEITNTGLLVSVHHTCSKYANLEVFDVSRKGQAMKIYSFEKVCGMTGNGDVTYNSRRGFLGAIPVTGEIAYHLYGVTTGKVGNTVNFIRKFRWHSQQSTERKNIITKYNITSLDFNANGETVATLDRNQNCLISDVNTHNCSFQMNMGISNGYDRCGRCRWTTNIEEPLLYVKYKCRYFNILDVEKEDLILKNPIELEFDGGRVRKLTHWIDVCPNNGNLLAASGTDKNVKIFDKREARIVRTFDGIHTDEINCVRWSPNGEMVASVSRDKKIALLDFKTGKNLYARMIADDYPPISVCFI